MTEKKSIILAGKPAKALNEKSKECLKILQVDIKRRYWYYKRGGQQGLEMVWRNSINLLRDLYLEEERRKKI